MISDRPADLKGSSGSGRRRIADVDGIFPFHDQKIVHQFAIGH
jgi:hypothetical protein